MLSKIKFQKLQESKQWAEIVKILSTRGFSTFDSNIDYRISSMNSICSDHRCWCDRQKYRCNVGTQDYLRFIKLIWRTHINFSKTIILETCFRWRKERRTLWIFWKNLFLFRVSFYFWCQQVVKTNLRSKYPKCTWCTSGKLLSTKIFRTDIFRNNFNVWL